MLAAARVAGVVVVVPCLVLTTAGAASAGAVIGAKGTLARPQRTAAVGSPRVTAPAQESALGPGSLTRPAAVSRVAGTAARVAVQSSPVGTQSFTAFSHSVVLAGGRTQTTVSTSPMYQRSGSAWRALSGRVTVGSGAHPLVATQGWEPVQFGRSASSLVSVALPGGSITLGLPGATVASPSLRKVPWCTPQSPVTPTCSTRRQLRG